MKNPNNNFMRLINIIAFTWPLFLFLLIPRNTTFNILKFMWLNLIIVFFNYYAFPATREDVLASYGTHGLGEFLFLIITVMLTAGILSASNLVPPFPYTPFTYFLFEILYLLIILFTAYFLFRNGPRAYNTLQDIKTKKFRKYYSFHEYYSRLIPMIAIIFLNIILYPNLKNKPQITYT